MKLDIRRKVLLLVLSGSLLTFLLLAVFLIFGLHHAGTTLDRENEELGREVAGFTEELVETQIKKHMEEITRLRAHHVDSGLTAASADVKYIAGMVNALLKNGVQSSAAPLPNAL